MLSCILAAFLGLAVYMFYVEPRWFNTRRVRIQFRKKLARNFTILHLSDTHFVDRNPAMDRFLNKLSETEYDFVFVTGDIIDHDGGIQPAAEAIKRFKTRGGIFAILGNHDYYYYRFFPDTFRYYLGISPRATKLNSVQQLCNAFEKNGIRILKNNSEKVTIGEQPFVICGTDDPVTQDVDFPKTFEGIRPDSFNILLTHMIDSLVQMPEADIDFALAGHTHGGQVRFPWIGSFVLGFKLPMRYIDGLHQYRNLWINVSRGVSTGRAVTPRFFCRPEAVVIEISS